MARKKTYDYLTFSECSKEFIRSTTFHGLRRAGWTRNACLRMMWVLLFFVGLAMFIYMMVCMTIFFFEYPKVTRMYKKVGFEPFPAVTICNTNPVKEGNVGDMLDPLYNFKLHANFTWNLTAPSMTELDPYKENRGDFSKVIAKKEYEDRVLLGHRLDEFVIYCAYDGRECDLQKDFSKAVWNDYYGACYTFGGQKPSPNSELKASNQKMVTGAGSVYGLNLILDTQSSEHLNRLTEEMGVRVLLHDGVEMPFPDEAGFSVPANMEALVSVNIEQVVRRRVPEGVCQAEGLNRYGFAYSATACNKICKQESVYEHCLCVSPSFQVDSFTGICSLNDLYSAQYKCYSEVMNMFKNGEKTCDCPPSCNETRYSYSYSLAHWPAGAKNDKDHWCEPSGYVDFPPSTHDNLGNAITPTGNASVCHQMVNQFMCGCRDANAHSSAANHPMLKSAPNCDLTNPTILECRNKVESRLRNGTITCDCTGRPSFVKDVLDELVRPTVKWDQTGRAGYSISNRPEDRVSLKVYANSIAKTMYVEESTFTLTDYLTHIGGLSALFIGCSLLTLLEVAEYLLTMLLIPCINFHPWVDAAEHRRRYRQQRRREREMAAFRARPSTSATMKDVRPTLDEVSLNERRIPRKYADMDDERKPITAT